MSIFNARNTSIKFVDNTSPTAVELALPKASGTVSITNLLAEQNRELLNVVVRGTHQGYAPGDDLVQEVSAELVLDTGAWSSADTANVMDWIRRTGPYTKGLSDGNEITVTSVDPCHWSWKVVLTFTGCDSNGDTVTKTITLPKFRGTAEFTEADPASTLSISGQNVVTPVTA